MRLIFAIGKNLSCSRTSSSGFLEVEAVFAPAVAAQLVALRPDLSPGEIEEVLKQTAAPARGPEGDIGVGSLDPEEALQSVQRE